MEEIWALKYENKLIKIFSKILFIFFPILYSEPGQIKCEGLNFREQVYRSCYSAIQGWMIYNG